MQSLLEEVKIITDWMGKKNYFNTLVEQMESPGNALEKLVQEIKEETGDELEGDMLDFVSEYVDALEFTEFMDQHDFFVKDFVKGLYLQTLQEQRDGGY